MNEKEVASAETFGYTFVNQHSHFHHWRTIDGVLRTVNHKHGDGRKRPHTHLFRLTVSPGEYKNGVSV